MKILSFSHAGKKSFGMIKKDRIIDLSDRCSDIREAFDLECVDALQSIYSKESGDIALGDVTYLPVVPHADARIFAMGWNYIAHAKEVSHPKDEYPYFFMKGIPSLVGHNQSMLLPKISDKFDFEGELVVVIGKAGRYINEADALDYVAGYSILNDGSIRDWQKKQGVLAGKNFDESSSYGPYLVTADEVGDPNLLQLETRLNGKLMQTSSTGDIFFKIPFLISYLSRFTQLRPGDAISTGTPGGVGHKRDPQVFMKAGDKIEVSISNIGVLTNLIEGE